MKSLNQAMREGIVILNEKKGDKEKRNDHKNRMCLLIAKEKGKKERVGGTFISTHSSNKVTLLVISFHRQ